MREKGNQREKRTTEEGKIGVARNESRGCRRCARAHRVSFRVLADGC